MKLFSLGKKKEMMQQEDSKPQISLKDAEELIRKEGKLYINLIQFQSIASSTPIFKDKLSEMKDVIITANKKLRSIMDENSIILYSNSPMDAEEAIQMSLEKTSVKKDLLTANLANLVVVSVSLTIDFESALISKIKRQFKDCSLVKGASDDIKIAFGKEEYIDVNDKISTNKIPDKAKFSLMSNPYDKESFIKNLLF